MTIRLQYGHDFSLFCLLSICGHSFYYFLVVLGYFLTENNCQKFWLIMGFLAPNIVAKLTKQQIKSCFCLLFYQFKQIR
jgi:hypothetical protein